MAKKIEAFFKWVEGIWGVIPNYVKVFLYSSISSAFGLFVAGKLDWMSVLIIVATNLGIYQVPRTVGSEVRKLTK